MTKQDILNTTGLSEEEFYQRYPDQEAFCSEYPEMCPDMMDDEDVSNEYVVESDYDDSLYEAKDGVETTAPYTDYNQYKNAMQTYGAESNKAATYNSFQNDLYNQSGKTRGSSETASQLRDMFNTLSPEQQDALAQKYGAQFITNTPSANRRNYVNSMEMTVPGKGTGYYSFPTNDVVYGNKDLERPNYELSAMKMTPYKMPATPPVKNSFQPAQIINNIGASYKDPASLNASNGNLPIPKHSLNSTMKKVGATNQPYVTSTPSYSSIVDLLKARKLDSSFTNRKKLAEEAGIKNYTGSASQNMDFINRMDDFNPYSTEMELGGENMFVNGGGIPMYGPGGQNLPTRSDSLFLLNNNKIINKLKTSGLYLDTQMERVDPKKWESTYNFKRKQLDDIITQDIKRGSKKGKPFQYKDVKGDFVGTQDWMYGGNEDVHLPKQYIHPKIAPQFEGDFYPKNSSTLPLVYSYMYDDLAITPMDMLTPAQQKLRLKKYPPVKQTQTKPQQTINTTQGQVTGTVRPNQIKGSELTMMINPVRSKENLKRMEMTPMRPLDIPIDVPHGELIPIRPKQTVTVNLGNTGTHPVNIYDRRGNFLRTEYTGDAEGVVDFHYEGDRKYAHRGGTGYIDLNAPIKEVEKRSNGGLVKYQKKGEVKQNPPKEFTDFKKFQRAERLYKDSLDTYNNSIIRRAEVIQNYKNAKNIKELIEANKKTKAKYPVNENISIKDKSEIIFKRKLPDGTTAHLVSDRHFKNPVQPVVFKPALTHPIEHLERLEMISPSLNSSNIQMKLQTIPMKPMKLKQRGTIPFYGPGNTLIGFTDDDRQFYPGEYTGAPHNQINLQDKYLLDHPELLKEYLKKRDNYKVDNFKVGGVNIHPAMRTNFKQGGLIKYEKGKEVKMKYGDFMNFVENPEMIQVDGMRSHYEPETNTIFYDTPRSIPDELGHAVQRANRNIGYSVPPNNNTMMRQLPEMQYVYPIDRENLDPFWVNENAGALNTIREINVPNNSNNSLSRTYVNKFFPGDKFGGNSYLKKLNDSNIYFVPGSGEYEAHQLIEPRIREDFFNYNKPQYKQGGYYGMDGRLHKAKGSGTYVTNGGYYFNVGGAAAADPPPAAAGSAAAGSATIYDNKPNPDGTFNVNNDYDYYGGYNEDDAEDYGGFQTQNERALKRQARRQERRNTQYETPDLGGLDESQYEEQPEEEVTAEPFDASNYSSAIDPSTGFTKWSKNNQALTNIKKQDPALWGHLKDEGKGARWETGQTDFQKFGRAAGKVGATLDAAINVAGAFGNLLNNRNEQRNLNNAAINQGSTASIYKNPQGASKGDYGQTGSSYGMTNPISVGARSFKGMYGKYGMQVPKYDIGGGFSNLFTSAQSVIPITKPMNLIPSGGSFKDSNGFNPFQNNMPIVESTGVYQDNRAVNQTADNNTVTTLDPDFALQSMAQFESGSKPGQAKVGMPTSLVGEGGKKASASGTFQITTPTLKDIFNNDKDISSKYGSFNKFKSAFDTDSKVEYEAARSLMARHIKNYGIYALGAWYYPEFARRAASGDKSVFDIVPRRDFGNRVKWGDDFNKKLNAYNKLAGTNYTLNTTFNAPKTAGTSAVIPTAKPAVSNYSPSNTNFSLKGLIDFAKTNKWVVTSTTRGRHNPGSRHKKSRAIDVSVNNKTPQQILDFMKLARSKGYRVLDERVRPKGQKEWHGAHLHLDFKKGGQFGGQVMEMDEDEITQFLKAGGQLEFLD